MFGDLIAWVGRLFSALGTFVLHVLRDIVQGHFRNLVADYKALKAALQKIFKPLVDALNWLRKWYTLHILKWQLLVQEILSRIRVVLSLFRLLGFKWAAKLDADIQKIMSVVTLSIQDVTRTLNAISGVLGVILDPGMVIRADFFHSSLFSALPALKRAAAYGTNTPLTASEIDYSAQPSTDVWRSPGIDLNSPTYKQVNSEVSKQMAERGYVA